MGLLADRKLKELALRGMITPFVDSKVRAVDSRQVISFGLSSFGYDMRLAREFKIFTNLYGGVVDPKNPGSMMLHDLRDVRYVDIPPHSYALARSLEYFNIPADVLAIVIGKSTYARSGIIVNCTPMEPGWCGYLTIEISNSTPLPARIYAEEGIAQAIFFSGDQSPESTYLGGKYQNQGPEPVLPRM